MKSEGVYGLPQAGKLFNDLLTTRLEAAGYIQAQNTPGLWSHKTRPIRFCLVVDNFGVEYVRDKNAIHLIDTLKQYYNIEEEWDGTNFLNIDLEWNYKHCTCHLSMKNYIEEVRVRYGHKKTTKPQYSPHKHMPHTYGAKTQLAKPQDTSDLVPEDKVKWIQGIVGAPLFYDRAVDNNVLVALGTLATQAPTATVNTVKAVEQLFDYICTYPNNGIIYRASGMQLAAHLDAGYLNKTKGRSRAGAHIFVLKTYQFLHSTDPSS